MQATRHPHAINVITNHKIVSNLSYHSSCNFNGVPLSLSLYSFLEDDEQKLIRHTRKASHPPSSSLFSLFPPFSPKRPHPFLFNRFFDFFINWFSNFEILGAFGEGKFISFAFDSESCAVWSRIGVSDL